MSDIPPHPTTPTDTRPGSPEKIAIMIARREAGLHLHHPDDMTCRIDPHEYHSIAFRFGDCISPPEERSFE